MVELFQRQANGFWLYSAVTGLDAAIKLPSIDCELALGDIYDRVEFPPEPGQTDSQPTGNT